LTWKESHDSPTRKKPRFLFDTPKRVRGAFAPAALQPLANEQPTGIGTFIAPLSIVPSRSRTGRALRPIVHAKGAYRGSEAPFIVNPLNASFVAQLDVEGTFSASRAIRYRFLPPIHAGQLVSPGKLPGWP